MSQNSENNNILYYIQLTLSSLKQTNTLTSDIVNQKKLIIEFESKT